MYEIDSITLCWMKLYISPWSCNEILLLSLSRWYPVIQLVWSLQKDEMSQDICDLYVTFMLHSLIDLVCFFIHNFTDT